MKVRDQTQIICLRRCTGIQISVPVRRRLWDICVSVLEYAKLLDKYWRPRAAYATSCPEAVDLPPSVRGLRGLERRAFSRLYPRNRGSPRGRGRDIFICDSPDRSASVSEAVGCTVRPARRSGMMMGIKSCLDAPLQRRHYSGSISSISVTT